MSRRRTVAAAVLAVAVVAAVVIVRTVQRDREWTHGGDAVDTAVELRLAEHETFHSTVVALGGPSRHDTGAPPGWRALVVRVNWSEAPNDDDHYYSLIALDKRTSPPRLLNANGAWVAGSTESTGSLWSNAYTELAEHYDWLADTAMVADRRSSSFPGSGVTPPSELRGSTWFTGAVSTPATSTGTLVANWFTGTADGRLPFTEPQKEVIIALVYVDDDGDVRWAKRISG